MGGVNRLQYVSIPSRKIKTNLSLVGAIMNEDKEFWRNVEMFNYNLHSYHAVV